MFIPYVIPSSFPALCRGFFFFLWLTLIGWDGSCPVLCGNVIPCSLELKKKFKTSSLWKSFTSYPIIIIFRTEEACWIVFSSSSREYHDLWDGEPPMLLCGLYRRTGLRCCVSVAIHCTHVRAAVLDGIFLLTRSCWVCSGWPSSKQISQWGERL